MKEKQLQKKCELALRELGCMCYHTYDSRKSSAGFPDLLVITRDSRLGVFELKREAGNTTVDQDRWLSAFALTEGATVAVIRPRDYDWLVSWAMGELR